MATIFKSRSMLNMDLVAITKIQLGNCNDLISTRDKALVRVISSIAIEYNVFGYALNALKELFAGNTKKFETAKAKLGNSALRYKEARSSVVKYLDDDHSVVECGHEKLLDSKLVDEIIGKLTLSNEKIIRSNLAKFCGSELGYALLQLEVQKFRIRQ